MIYNLNDILREKIYNSSLLKIIQNYRKLDYFDKEKLIRLILSDYYKVFYLINGNITSISYENVENTIYLFDFDMDFCYILISYMDRFYNLSYFQKCILFENISRTDYDLVFENISSTHILDKITYKVIDELENYKYYYKEQKYKNGGSIEQQNNLCSIIGKRIINLKHNNINKYNEFIFEFVKVYYKWKTFIMEHDGAYLLNKEDLIYIGEIKNKNFCQIIDKINNDADFFYTILGEYLHYTTEEIEIDESAIDEYLLKSGNNEIIKKLKR